MRFEVLSDITNVEIIAVGRRIRQVERLMELFGKGRWRKMKGRAFIRVPSGQVRHAEIHCYEAHGIGSVIDEDGEDYLYPADWFAAVEVSKAVEISLRKAS